ncbi:hypothetical protein BHE74_00030358, partial [Ensete ventricosum]
MVVEARLLYFYRMRLDATRAEGSSGNVRDDDSSSVGGDMGCDHRSSKVEGAGSEGISMAGRDQCMQGRSVLIWCWFLSNTSAADSSKEEEPSAEVANSRRSRVRLTFTDGYAGVPHGLDESLGRQHMGAVYHRGSSQIASTSESHGGDLIILRYDRSSWRVGLLQCSHSLKGARQVRGQSRVVERGEEATTSPVGLSYPKAKRRLERRWTRRSTTVPQRRIYRSRRKGCRCKSTDSRAMGLAAPWYRRGGTSVESSIPCSHGGRALVAKGAKEVENAK